jgi:hypothetical protein
LARELRSGQSYETAIAIGAPMFLSLILSHFHRRASFVWSPSLDLRDHAIYSTLIPGAQY